jgi:hypothetical protein
LPGFLVPDGRCKQCNFIAFVSYIAFASIMWYTCLTINSQVYEKTRAGSIAFIPNIANISFARYTLYRERRLL